MKLELLYVAGCPNHPLALARLRETMALARVNAHIEEIEVINEPMAARLSFPGSPTILVDGKDLEDGVAAHPSMGCRIYQDPESGRWGGIPSVEAILQALRAAC